MYWKISNFSNIIQSYEVFWPRIPSRSYLSCKFFLPATSEDWFSKARPRKDLLKTTRVCKPSKWENPYQPAEPICQFTEELVAWDGIKSCAKIGNRWVLSRFPWQEVSILPLFVIEDWSLLSKAKMVTAQCSIFLACKFIQKRDSSLEKKGWGKFAQRTCEHTKTSHERKHHYLKARRPYVGSQMILK